MTITSAVNCFYWLVYDETGIFCQADDDHVGTLFEETCKINSHWLVSNLIKYCNPCTESNVCTKYQENSILKTNFCQK